MTVARLYYEAHITLEASEEQSFEDFKIMCGERWKVSRFDEDEVDGYDGKWFASARHGSLETIKEIIASAANILAEHGFFVLRAKIEDTVLDTKYGDYLFGPKAKES